MLLDRIEQRLRAGLLDRHRGAAEAPREDQQHAEPEGEGDRRRAGPAVVGAGLQYVTREAVGRSQHVAMEMDAALGLSGRARSEGDHRHVVACRRHRREARRDRFEARLELALAMVAVIAKQRTHGAGGFGAVAEIADEAAVDDRMADLGPRQDGLDLAGPQHRHGRDQNSAGLEHAQPGREQHHRIGAAQEHPVAGNQSFLLDQQPRDPARKIVDLGIGPAAIIVDHRRRVRSPACHQFDRRVERVRILKLWAQEQEFRLVRGRRQPVADEAVDLRAFHDVFQRPSLRANAKQSSGATARRESRTGSPRRCAPRDDRRAIIPAPSPLPRSRSALRARPARQPRPPP